MTLKPTADNGSRKSASLERILKDNSTTSNMLRNNNILNAALL